MYVLIESLEIGAGERAHVIARLQTTPGACRARIVRTQVLGNEWLDLVQSTADTATVGSAMSATRE